MKQLSDIIERKFNKFFEEKDFDIFFYQVYFYIGIFICFMTSVLNYIMELPRITIIMPTVFGLLNLLIYWVVHKKNHNLCVLLTSVCNNFFLTPFMWLSNSGMNGGFQYFTFLMLIFTIVLLRGTAVIINVFGFLLTILGLLLLEVYNPDIIIKFSGPGNSTVDVIVSIIFSMIFVALTIFALSGLYRYDQRKIRDLSIKDPLTKQYNRRFIIDYLEKLYQRQTEQVLTDKFIAFLDVDNFKEINDKYGHNKGDELLVNICNTICENIRETDYLARMGGDEFLIVINTESNAKAKFLMKRVVERIESGNGVTISAGLTCMKNNKNVSELLEQADSCMYSAKRTGKNKIVFETT